MENDQSSFLSSSKSIDIIEGNITSNTKQNDLSTLDEPIFQTIKRDFIGVLQKFSHAIIPRKSSSLLQQWDLWGPLILITTLAILLQSNATKASNGVKFAEVFSLMFIGAIVVTINAQLLGGKISIFQSICILGYCLLPLLIAAFINNFLLYFSPKAFLHIIRFIIVMIAFIWTMYASLCFLDQNQFSNRRLLILYPIFLFYFLISWLIILHAHPK